MTNTSRTNRTTTRDLAALRAEIKALKAQLALHEECLEITAEALKALQDKALKASAGESPKETAPKKPKAKKASAPKEQGRPWSKLTKAEQSRCNKAVWANPQAHGFKDWTDWTEKRTTIIFR